MTTRTHLVIGILLTTAAWSAADLCAAEPGPDRRLRITLRAEVEPSEPLVHIADIAQISGGSPSERTRAGELDLIELGPDATSVEASRVLVQARLLLSGVAPDGFIVDGAPLTRILAPASRSPEDRALAAARSAIVHQLSLSAEEVVVRLSQPLLPDVLEGIEATPAGELEARLPADVSGQTRIELWMRDARGVQRTKSILVDVRFRQLVPVATRPLKPRQTLTEDDVTLESRALSQRGVALRIEQVVGKALRRPVVTGDVLKDSDLIASVAADEPLLVKPRDVVRVTVKKGTLTLVMPAAEALQSGRAGETIRVRNTRSGRVVVGRVIGEGEVEVPL